MTNKMLVMAAGLTFFSANSAPAAALIQAMERPSADAQIDARVIVAEVRRILAERYVLPERRAVLDTALAEGLAAGRYTVRDPALLAQRINADLEAAGRDKHLGFSFNPAGAAMLRAPGSDGPPDTEAWERLARTRNHGVTELRVLPGNIRYLAYDGFMWTGAESAAALEAAMRFLQGGEAAIIDIRRNGGGSPQAVQYLVSHFLPAARPLVSFYMGGRPEPDRLSTLADLPAGRMIGKPLYVLISGGSASAAEEFSGHVAGFQLGELVGITTAGAAFRNQLVPVGDGYVLSVSVGRPVLAATGGDWEATGIAPTIPADVGKALEIAQVHALRRLARNGRAEDRGRLEALAEGIAARLEPGTTALPLAAYAGTFGERLVSLEDGRLHYRRQGLPGTALIPLGGNRFALDTDPALRLEFVADDGQVSAFQLGAAGGPSQGRYDRTPERE